MEQYVIKTGAVDKSSQYLSKSMFVGYYYTAKAYIFDSLKEANMALSWGKKDNEKNIKELKKSILIYDKEVKKGNISVNKVLLIRAKEDLKNYESIKLKLIKL